MSYCGNCGHEITGNPKFCSKCGKMYFSYETVLEVMLAFLAMLRVSEKFLYDHGGSRVPENHFYDYYTLELVLAQCTDPESAHKYLVSAVQDLGQSKTGGTREFLKSLLTLGLEALGEYREDTLMGTALPKLLSHAPKLFKTVEMEDPNDQQELEYQVLGLLHYALVHKPDEPTTKVLIELLLDSGTSQ
jgi:hypothetical protein